MTFDTTESSVASGKPAELYLFTRSAAPGTDTTLIGGQYTGPIVWRGDSLDNRIPNPGWTVSKDQAGNCSNCGTVVTSSHVSGQPASIDGVRFCGGLGGGGGFYEIIGTFTELTPNKKYRIWATGTKVDSGFLPNGIAYIIEGGAQEIAADYKTSVGGWNEDVTVSATGTMEIRFGIYDLEFGSGCYSFEYDAFVIQELPTSDGGTWTQPTGGASESVAYTSADEPIVYSGDTYYPAILTRTELGTGGTETSSTDTSVTLPRDHEVSQWFAEGNDERPVTVTIYRLHRSDLSLAVTPVIARVTEAEFSQNQCVLTLAPLALHTLNRSVPRDRWSPGCNLVVYGSRCKASRVLHTLQDAEVLAISSDGLEVTVEGLADYAATYDDRDVFAGGYIVPASGPSRGIRFSSGDVLTLVAPITGLAVSSTVSVVEGCALTTDACINQFDNLENYFGFPTIPLRNPADPAGSGFA